MPKKTKSTTSHTPRATSHLTWLPKKTFELEITISKKEVEKEYKKALKTLAQKATIKGFRKGKAPTKIVEQQFGKEAIYKQVVNQILPQAYSDAVKKHNLKPIIAPQITPVKMKADEDWVLKAKAAEAPDIKLGNWEKTVKETKKPSKLWTPDKGSPDKQEKKEETQDQKLNKIFKALLTETTIEISNLVIEDETNRMLSRLLDQINKLGLTIDQYLTSNNKTQESLRREYRETAERTLKLEFILLKLAQEKKISVSDEEIDKMTKTVPDEKTRKNLQTPQQKAYISTVIRKRKTLDMLLNLV